MSDDLPPDRLATRRLIELVGVLHRRGYEGVRLRPSLAPSGCYWRASLHSGRHPALTTRGFSSGAGWGLLFGWPDAEHLGLEQLADRFLVEFTALAEDARHSDPDYAAWYAAMLSATAPHGYVYFAADFDLPTSGVGVGGCDPQVEVPAPPKARSHEGDR